MCGKVASEKGNNSSELFCSLPSTQLSHNINNVGIAGKFLKYLEFHCILIDGCFSGLIKVWFALLSNLLSRECALKSYLWSVWVQKKPPRLKGIESSIGKKLEAPPKVWKKVRWTLRIPYFFPPTKASGKQIKISDKHYYYLSLSGFGECVAPLQFEFS